MQSCDLVLENSRMFNSLESENFSLILATRDIFFPGWEDSFGHTCSSLVSYKSSLRYPILSNNSILNYFNPRYFTIALDNIVTYHLVWIPLRMAFGYSLFNLSKTI